VGPVCLADLECLVDQVWVLVVQVWVLVVQEWVQVVQVWVPVDLVWDQEDQVEWDLECLAGLEWDLECLAGLEWVQEVQEWDQDHFRQECTWAQVEWVLEEWVQGLTWDTWGQEVLIWVLWARQWAWGRCTVDLTT
jgi:hypothetical protein